MKKQILNFLTNHFLEAIGFVVIIALAYWAWNYIRTTTRESNNDHLFDFIPNAFPTLGIFFTFLGIAYGLYRFDSNDIESSIPELMNGLKTAFLVSLLGVGLLLVFSYLHARKKHELEKDVLSEETTAINQLGHLLSQFRNDFFYIDDEGKSISISSSIKNLKDEVKSQSLLLKQLKDDFQMVDENGNNVKPGNILRDIFMENEKQTETLQNFSTELATNISAGFESIINNPSEGILVELRIVQEEISKLADKLKDPTTDMTQRVVKDLQESMSKMIEEFKTSMSGDTKTEMEGLASILRNTGESLNDFPNKISEMMTGLNLKFESLHDVVNNISKNTLEQSTKSSDEMARQIEEMSKIVKDNVGELQSSQSSLIKEQNSGLEVSHQLMTELKNTISTLHTLTEGISNSIGSINSAHTGLENVVSGFQSASQHINTTSNSLYNSQQTFTQYTSDFTKGNKESLSAVNNSLEKAQNLSNEYVTKFAVIEKGLQGIFEEIQVGLTNYKSTVGSSLEDYLGKYSLALTDTANALQNAASMQESVYQELSEEIGKLTKMKKDGKN